MRSIVSCGRCDANIPEHDYNRERPIQFMRRVDEDQYETDEVRLCSMCLDDVWEFVFETELDRSEKVDPIPLDRAGATVERHVGELQQLLDAIEEAKTDA